MYLKYIVIALCTFEGHEQKNKSYDTIVGDIVIIVF